MERIRLYGSGDHIHSCDRSIYDNISENDDRLISRVHLLIAMTGYFMLKRALKQVDLICDQVENISYGKDLAKASIAKK